MLTAETIQHFINQIQLTYPRGRNNMTKIETSKQNVEQ